MSTENTTIDITSLLNSGWMASPRYEIEVVPCIPGTSADCAVKVQLNDDAIREIIWWFKPEYKGFPIREITHLEDSDELLDLTIKAVRAWVATFPPIAVKIERHQAETEEAEVVVIESLIRAEGWKPYIGRFDAFRNGVVATALKDGHKVPAIYPSPGSEKFYVHTTGVTRLEAARDLNAKVLEAAS